MAQPILKRKLNPLLLISTVAALVLLAGVSVIAQDQISQKTEQFQDANQTKTELQTEVNRMESKLQNRSVRMTELERQINALKADKESLNETIAEKDQRIQELEQQVEEAQNNQDLEETLDDINSSLAVVCLESSGGPGIDNNCNEWGHEVGTSDES